MEPSPQTSTQSITISVITVVRNDRDGLLRTLESCAAQTFDSFEHVIFDGASTDGTAELLAAWRTDVRTVKRSERDGGIYDAMNKAVQMASGELLIFMNAGDTFTGTDDLGFVASEWHAGGWRWGYGASRYVRDGQPIQGIVQAPFRLRRFELGLTFVPHQSAYIERTLFHELGGYRLDVGLSADQQLLMRAARMSPPAVWIRFLSDFELGGAHSKSSEMARVRRWHRIRKMDDRLILGSNIADSVFSIAHGVAQLTRRLLSEALRR